jgi:hypothetical protein
LRDFEEAGIDQVICLSQATNTSHDMLSSSIELFSKEVLPEFKDRDQKSARAKAERRERLTELCMPRRPKARSYFFAASAFIFLPSASVYHPAFTSWSTDCANLLW